MNRNNLIRAMTAFALVALIVGVLVWPTPKEAMAFDQQVTVTINWHGTPAYGIAPYVNFYDLSWGSTGSMNLSPNNDSTAWNGTFLSLPAGTVRCKIYWNDSQRNWDLTSAQTLSVDNLTPVLLGLNCWI